MSPIVITLIVVAVMIVAMIALYIVGNKLQKKQMEQREELMGAAQQVSMLIIDKKMMKMKDAGLPKQVMEQTPKRFRGAKLPIVKAKVGPQTLNLICDEGIFDELPTKVEAKVMLSGIYITEVKSVRGKKKNTQAEEDKNKKVGFSAKMRKKQRELQAEIAADQKEKEAKKAEKAAEKARKEKAKKITK